MRTITLSSDNGDTELNKLEKKIARVYRKATTEAETELNEYFDQYNEEDEQKKQELDDLYKKVALGLVAYAVYRAAKKSYNNWRMNQFMSGKQWENVKVKVANILGKAESFVEKLVNDHIKTIYAAGYNTTLFDFETGTLVDTTLPIYTQLSIQYILKNNPSLLPVYNQNSLLNQARNRQKLNSVIIQGIINGESIPKLAKRIQKVTNSNYKAAIRTARTASGAAMNKGKLLGFKAISDMGFNIRKQWVSTLDNRTRHEHRLLMGQTVKLGEPFKINGYELSYPCDPTAIKKNPSTALGTQQAVDIIEAAPEMIYNCRCVIVGILEGFEKTIEDFDYQTNPKLNGMTLDEWRNAKPVYK